MGSDSRHLTEEEIFNAVISKDGYSWHLAQCGECRERVCSISRILASAQQAASPGRHSLIRINNRVKLQATQGRKFFLDFNYRRLSATLAAAAVIITLLLGGTNIFKRFSTFLPDFLTSQDNNYQVALYNDDFFSDLLEDGAESEGFYTNAPFLSLFNLAELFQSGDGALEEEVDSNLILNEKSRSEQNEREDDHDRKADSRIIDSNSYIFAGRPGLSRKRDKG